MFITVEHARLDYPAALFGEGCQGWRFASLSMFGGWFLAVLASGEGRTTLLLSHEPDVLALVEDPSKAQLVELQLFVPPWASDAQTWAMHRVVAVYTAVDDDSAPAIVYLTDHGDEFEAFPGRAARPQLHSRKEVLRLAYASTGAAQPA